MNGIPIGLHCELLVNQITASQETCTALISLKRAAHAGFEPITFVHTTKKMLSWDIKHLTRQECCFVDT